MTRTTILLEDDLLFEVRRAAKATGVTVTEIVRGALKAYISRQSRPRLPSFAAIGRSKGPGNIAVNADKILRDDIKPHKGWKSRGRSR